MMLEIVYLVFLGCSKRFSLGIKRQMSNVNSFNSFTFIMFEKAPNMIVLN